jgi:hypothetical protein
VHLLHIRAFGITLGERDILRGVVGPPGLGALYLVGLWFFAVVIHEWYLTRPRSWCQKKALPGFTGRAVIVLHRDG